MNIVNWSQSVKRWMLIATIFAVPILAIFWIATHAFIELDVSNAAAGEITYQLSADGSASNKQSGSRRIKRLVRSDNYEIYVRQNNATYYAVKKSGRFLGTTKVAITLQPEKQRTFVGNNPSYCMNYTGEMLLSWNCQDDYGSLNRHIPSTQTTPTYVARPAADARIIEGMVKLKNGRTVIVLKDNGTQQHLIAYVSGDGSLIETRQLNGVEFSPTYTLTAYKTGILLYDQTFERTYYLADITAAAQPVSIPDPKDIDLRPYSLTVTGDAIVATYSNVGSNEVDLDDPKAGAKVEVRVIVADSSKSFKFNQQVTNAYACGSSKLCLLINKQMVVYDISGSKSKLLFKLSNVNLMESSLMGMIVAVNDKILLFDVDERTGFASYDLGKYTFCGLVTDTAGYTLCLISPQQSKQALRVDYAGIDADSIDKKILALYDVPYVDSVSVSGTIISITPKLGEMVYSDELESFTYDPGTQQAADSAINQAIDKAGINRSTYTIVNTSAP